MYVLIECGYYLPYRGFQTVVRYHRLPIPLKMILEVFQYQNQSLIIMRRTLKGRQRSVNVFVLHVYERREVSNLFVRLYQIIKLNCITIQLPQLPIDAGTF